MGPSGPRRALGGLYGGGAAVARLEDDQEALGREGREALHEFGCLLERRVGRVGGEGLRQFFLCAGEDSASVAYGDYHKVHTAPVASEFI